MENRDLTRVEKHDKMTVQEVADDLRVHRTTVSRLMTEGILPYHLVGSRKIIKRADLETYFDSQRVENSKDFAQHVVN